MILMLLSSMRGMILMLLMLMLAPAVKRPNGNPWVSTWVLNVMFTDAANLAFIHQSN